MLVSAGADLRVILWDVTDPTHPRPLGLPVTGHADPVKSLSLSRDGRTLASGSFSEVQLWDLRIWPGPDRSDRRSPATCSAPTRCCSPPTGTP